MEYFDESEEIVWKDRKRWLGLPWTFTRYNLIKKEGEYAKLVNINGLLSTSTEEVNLFRVDDIDVNQSMFDKLFGVGTITVYCNDASCAKLLIQKVKEPFKVRALINKMVIEDRKRAGVRLAEFNV